MDQMFLDDLVDVFSIHVCVPDTFRIYDHNWSFFASIEAPCRIDAYLPSTSETQSLNSRFRVVSHRLRVMTCTTSRAVVALVDAKKHVISIIGHGASRVERL